MNCAEVLDLLSAYYDGEIDADSRSKVESHFRECAECEKELASFEKLSSLTAALEKPETPSEVWSAVESGLEEELATKVVKLIDSGHSQFRPLYDDDMPLWEKIRTVTREIYGADDAIADKKVRDQIAEFEAMGYGNFPICMAKKQIAYICTLKKLNLFRQREVEELIYPFRIYFRKSYQLF